MACKDEVLTVDDDELVNSECTLSHAGPSDAGWRVDWIRKDTGDRLSSTSHDVSGRVRRVLLFAAKYPESGGEYVCTVSSRRPIYVDSCTTQIHVRRKVSYLLIGYAASFMQLDETHIIIIISSPSLS